MKAKVNKDICIACGACTQIAENIFDFGKDGLAEVKEEVNTIKKEDKENVLNAAEGCPVNAIEVEEKED